MLEQFFGGGSVQKITKWVVISLALLSLFLLVQVFIGLKKLPFVGKDIFPRSTITVVGEGESFAIPNIATFNFSVVEIGDTVVEAQGKLDEKVNRALASLREAGVEDKDIKTTNYSVYPKYEWEQQFCVPMIGVVCPPGRSVLKGFEVNQTIEIKVRDIKIAPDLVTKIGAVGVSNIGNLEFTVDNKDKYIAEARNEAIEKARKQAEEVSKQLGVRLKGMLYFNESGNYLPPKPMGEMEMQRDAVNLIMPAKAELPHGETRITSQVNITYEIR